VISAGLPSATGVGKLGWANGEGTWLFSVRSERTAAHTTLGGAGPTSSRHSEI